jgi:hypothetical protein
VRALVVGTYPPPATTNARSTMALVRQLTRDGRDVEVLGPPHSAAARRARIDGPAGALELWRNHRRYDEVYVMIDAALRHPVGRLARFTRILDCAVWALALRFAKNTCVVVRDPGGIPGSVGGRTGRLLWQHAPQLLVPNDYSAQMLIDLGGAPADRVRVAATPTEVEPDRWNRGWADVTDQASATAAIQRRAAQDRRRAAQ